MSANNYADSVQIARKYLDSLVLEGRVLGGVHPSTQVTILGATFDTPIMTGALSHLRGGMVGFAEGARRAGALCAVGMCDSDTLGGALMTGAKIMKIVKPYANREAVLSRLRYAEAHGAFAVGMDVEHAAGTDSDADWQIAGEKMQQPTLDELRKFIHATSLPFFVKGAQSVHDALTARELGAAGVILSQHSAQMPWAAPPCMLLRDIRRAVGEDFILIADGGMEDGFDAFKALALGANLVSVGRPLIDPYDRQGPDGIASVLNAYTNEVRAMLLRTGSKDPASIDPSVIHEAWWLR